MGKNGLEGEGEEGGQSISPSKKKKKKSDPYGPSAERNISTSGRKRKRGTKTNPLARVHILARNGGEGVHKNREVRHLGVRKEKVVQTRRKSISSGPAPQKL